MAIRVMGTADTPPSVANLIAAATCAILLSLTSGIPSTGVPFGLMRFIEHIDFGLIFLRVTILSAISSSVCSIPIGSIPVVRLRLRAPV